MEKQQQHSTTATGTSLDQESLVRDDPKEFNLKSSLAVAGSAMTYFVTVGFLNAFGVFQEYYHSVVLRGHTDFQIAFLGSFSTFIFFLSAMPAGLLSDRFGPTTPMIIGSFIEIFALFMVSLCHEYYQFFLAQGLLLGIGMGLIAVPASTVVPKYFVRNRGLVTGISIAGSSLGGTVWPIIFNELFNHRHLSFGWSMRIAGFIMIPLLLICVLITRPPAPSKSDGESGVRTSTKAKPKANLSFLKTRRFLLLCGGLAFSFFGFFSPFFFATPYAVSLGFSSSLAFYLLSIMNVASLFGRIIPGYLADKYIGRFNTLAMSALTGGVVAFCWTAARSVPGVIVWVAAYGFASGAILSQQMACAASLGDASSTGALIGATLTSVSITGLFGPPISGELVKRGYLSLSCFAGATLVFGGVLMMLARLTINKKLWAKV